MTARPEPEERGMAALVASLDDAARRSRHSLIEAMKVFRSVPKDAVPCPCCDGRGYVSPDSEQRDEA